jgi:hypothetical protein
VLYTKLSSKHEFRENPPLSEGYAFVTGVNKFLPYFLSFSTDFREIWYEILAPNAVEFACL